MCELADIPPERSIKMDQLIKMYVNLDIQFTFSNNLFAQRDLYNFLLYRKSVLGHVHIIVILIHDNLTLFQLTCGKHSDSYSVGATLFTIYKTYST